jgi:hypothetical protein
MSSFIFEKITDINVISNKAELQTSILSTLPKLVLGSVGIDTLRSGIKKAIFDYNFDCTYVIDIVTFPVSFSK